MTTNNKYVIFDYAGPGYACNDPIEGWIFTYLDYSATKFDSREEAKEVIKKHYGNNPALVIKTTGEII